MQTHQAIIFTCNEDKLEQGLKSFVENDMNLYAVDYIKHDTGIKVLLDDTPDRNHIFEKFEICFTQNNTPRVVLFSHNACVDLGDFETADQEIHERELKLRHAVSVVQSKYPDKQVEAYLAALNADDQAVFVKVI